MFSRHLPHAFAICLLIASAASAPAQRGNDEVTPEVQRLYNEAHDARLRGDSAAMIEKYRAIIKLAPHLAAAYNNLGMAYFNQHDYARAAEVLKRGLELNPSMPSASAMLGISYFQLGELDKAEPLLRAALKANPKDDQAQLILIQILVNQHQLQEAVPVLQDYLSRNPRAQEAWYLLGKSYMQLSEDALKKINEIDPDSVVAHEISGEIDESMHNYDLALVEYKKAVDLAPNAPGTHMHMGNAYWNIGKWQSAETEFRAELVNDPNSCMAHWRLANSTLEANDAADDALTHLDAAIARCPALTQAHVDRARALIRLGRHPDALPELQLAVKESPREPSIHFLLAAVYRAQGQSAAAQKEMALYGQLQREAAATTAGQASDVNTIKSNAK
ncbi:MAG TPA: tetratricopeptide repeat protein [Terracidiphilus sp.]|nr:tetratricopeptide repeat protein [Terracidiphilus sp.]